MSPAANCAATASAPGCPIATSAAPSYDSCIPPLCQPLHHTLQFIVSATSGSQILDIVSLHPMLFFFHSLTVLHAAFAASSCFGSLNYFCCSVVPRNSACCLSYLISVHLHPLSFSAASYSSDPACSSNLTFPWQPSSAIVVLMAPPKLFRRLHHHIQCPLLLYRSSFRICPCQLLLLTLLQQSPPSPSASAACLAFKASPTA